MIMLRIILVILLLFISNVADAQLDADYAARAFGFNSYQHYLQARQHCLDLFNKQVASQVQSSNCGQDLQCLQREANALIERHNSLTRSPEWTRNLCDRIVEIEAAKNRTGENEDDNRFEVVAAISGCKYFIVEQGSGYSLVEDWLCSRPGRGDIGYGDVGSFGIKDVKLNGYRCSVYVDDWLLSKSRATEKLVDKCR